MESGHTGRSRTGRNANNDQDSQSEKNFEDAEVEDQMEQSEGGHEAGNHGPFLSVMIQQVFVPQILDSFQILDEVRMRIR